MLLCHNLADSVKSAQRERGLNNEEMARRAGVSRTTLSGLLRGEGNPRLSTVERIAEKLGREPVLLLCWARDDAEREWFERTLEMLAKAGTLGRKSASDLWSSSGHWFNARQTKTKACKSSHQ